MDLHRHLQSLALLIFVLATYFSATLARHHRHHHGRHKRQHSPDTFVLDVTEPEVGDWGPWSQPSPCSRTCGGGVATQTRECRQDSSVACGGASKKYFSCNIQDCPEEAIDFRAEQCAFYNDKPFDRVLYNWIPYTKGGNKCELNCMPKGERFYYRFSDKVADGTRCEEEKLDVCVDGKCLPVGCDNLLGSHAREDLCRECGGDGSNCNTAKGVLDMDNLQVGYNDILLIPAGAMNIRIREVKSSNNYLAIRNATGHYYLNGNWRIDYPRSIRCVGTIFHYERKPHGFFSLEPETLTALGPTTEAIYIVLLYQERNTGIAYQYSLPKGAVTHTDPDSYVWVTDEFQQCNATCGGGVQTRRVLCAKRKDSIEVSSDLCDAAIQPSAYQECAREPCAPQWRLSDWTACSQSCGEGGTQTRQIVCEQIVSNGRASLVESSQCEDTLGPPPPSKQVCGEQAPCPIWHIGPWAPCDKLCGDGKQRRKVTCYHKVDGKIEVLPDSACSLEKPDVDKPCNLRPCEGVDWVVTEWTGCEDKCGYSFETRQAHCSTNKGQIYQDSFCSKSRLPELIRPCNASMPCKHEWFASQWSECSSQCGSGIQTRKVFCGTYSEDGIEKADDSKCDAALKYDNTKNCTGKEECKGHWFAGPWTTCSKPCGGGMKSRKVLCFMDNRTVNADLCDPEEVIFASEDCNKQACGEDQIITINPKQTIIEEEEEEEETDEEECEDEDSLALISSSFTDDLEGVTKFTTEIEGSGMSSIDTWTSLKLGSRSFDMDTTDMKSELSTDFFNDATDRVTTYDGSGSSDLFSISQSSVDDTSKIEDTSESTEGSTSYFSTGSILDDVSISSSGMPIEVSTTYGQSTQSSIDSDTTDSTIIDYTTIDSTKADSTTIDGTTIDDTTIDSTTIDIKSSDSSSSEHTTDASSTLETTTDSISTSDGVTTTDIQTTENPITEQSPSTTEESKTQFSSERSSFESTISSTTKSEIESTTSESMSSTESNTNPSTISSHETTDLTNVSNDSEPTATSSSSDSSTSTFKMDVSTELDSTTKEFDLSTGSISTESLSTESILPSSSETSTISSEEYLSSTSGISSTADIWSVLTTGSESTTASLAPKAITKKPKRVCKKKKSKKKKEMCEISEFGCCFDNTTSAQGPFHKGCPTPETCKDTKFGCCPDNVSPALGKNSKGCPPSQCNSTLFGCCPDGVSISEGNDNEGCPVEVTQPPTCEESLYGCCPEGIIPATGPDFAGCYVCEGSGDCDSCNNTKFGCCPDGVLAAQGPDFDGCEVEVTTLEIENKTYYTDCENSTYGCCWDGISAASGPDQLGCGDEPGGNCSESSYGCCPDGNTTASGPDNQGCPSECFNELYGCCDDNITAAHGPNREGCCLNTAYGCCPDNIVPAQGANLEGCGCQYSPYGCCPDNKTVARGPDNQGCGCQYTPNGCCPNQYTPAAGPRYQGCPCHTYQFGCCPDGVTRAIGPNLQGCGCENTEFGCCPDGRTPASGPNRDTCSCAASKYGCCPDGVSEAQGENFMNCEEIPLTSGDICTQPKARGSCRNFTVKWFFDTEYGGCSRFWYGGCEGNENQFKNNEECKSKCVEPAGKDACYLPKTEGPCEGYYPMWYYNTERKQCNQFIYGGCLGNNNKFETREACQELCEVSESLDACEHPKEEGPCRGNFTRWYYDKENHICSEFNYGGCMSNKNNFLSEIACKQKCLQPGRGRDECSLPRAQGSCKERLPKWFFDASENRCMPFYYTGCEGNANRFDTRESCETTCPPKIEQGTCLLPALVGECHNYTGRWYYDSYDSQCKQFYYGGCGGNSNNFQSQNECQRQCDNTYAVPAPEPPPPFTPQSCFLPEDAGTCSNEIAQWYYDSRVGVCKQFIYSGCEGNGNRFTSSQECEQQCGNVQDICTLPQVVGPCNGNYQQWFYNQTSQTCVEFEYGGCQGNGNRFATENDCRRRCGKETPLDKTTEISTVPSNGICNQIKDAGPCTMQVAAWFFSPTEKRCEPFVYGGCEGNANRFLSIEQCERQCGEYRSLDVCNEPVDVGPCIQQHRKWYFDRITGSCQEFNYGGCYGTANRFSTLIECESICLQREEPLHLINNSSAYLEICKLAVDPGPCNDGQFKRWAYSEANQTCVPFIYNGCAGNLNRFKSFKSCLDYCRPGAQVQPTVQTNEIDIDDPCQKFTSTCQSLTQCEYGVERWVDENGCENCRCNNPCLTTASQCPENTTCTVILHRNDQTGETDYRAVCRIVTKEGECPQLSSQNTNCAQECNTDADCEGRAKCCYNGCGTSCVDPFILVTQGPPSEPEVPGAVPPSIEENDREVQAEEGNYATLRCVARGTPIPVLTWIHRGQVLGASGGKYKFLNGSLQIIGLVPSDAGLYLCSADNGIGRPVEKEFVLKVLDPVNRTAAVVGDDSDSVIVSLGAQTVLHCYAIGYPPPTVIWWRGSSMLPISNEQFEQRRDHSLVLHSVTLTALGPYTCQAYNGIGRAASWTVILKAIGPAYSQDPNDVTSNQYLVPPPISSPSDNVPRGPPYRPYRPQLPTTIAPQEPEVTRRVFVVPVTTNISLEKTTFPVGSDISILCDVDGYPTPRVDWYKDNFLLQSSSRIQISDSSRLIISQANANDTGVYKCVARNDFTSSETSVAVTVEGVYIHPNCFDKPFFANCKLVVQGSYCTHKYYAKFCCESCTLAGQLPSIGPHLYPDSNSNLRNRRRRRRSLVPH